METKIANLRKLTFFGTQKMDHVQKKYCVTILMIVRNLRPTMMFLLNP